MSNQDETSVAVKAKAALRVAFEKASGMTSLPEAWGSAFTHELVDGIIIALDGDVAKALINALVAHLSLMSNIGSNQMPSLVTWRTLE